MRTVIQRVKSANVKVDGEIVGEIQKGLLVLLAIHTTDSDAPIEWLANKIVNLRIFPDQEDKMNLSVKDIKGEILIVSQFTLYGDCNKGNRPSFVHSASGEQANKLYQAVVEKVKSKLPNRVETGQFAAKMEVSLINDGPVTFITERM